MINDHSHLFRTNLVPFRAYRHPLLQILCSFLVETLFCHILQQDSSNTMICLSFDITELAVECLNFPSETIQNTARCFLHWVYFLSGPPGQCKLMQIQFMGGKVCLSCKGKNIAGRCQQTFENKKVC